MRLALKKFAISGLVAHDDIEPTKEWQDEIEAALFSMDALAALITTDFYKSKWADQEVGVAIGRGVLIVPVKRDADPHGFINKYQAINGRGKTVNQVAKSIFEVLFRSSQTRSRMLACMVDATAFEQDEKTALARLELIASLKDIPKDSLERLKEGVTKNQVFMKSSVLMPRLLELLKDRSVSPVYEAQEEVVLDEDIPF